MNKSNPEPEISEGNEEIANTEDEKSFSPVGLNPLLIDNVVAKILDFLSIDELKISREVCNLWAEEGARHLLNKSFIILTKLEDILNQEEAKEDARQILAQFLSPLSHRPANNLKIYMVDESFLSSWKILDEDWIPTLCSRVSHIKYPRDIRRLEGYTRLSLLLEKFVNLRILDTVELNISAFQQLLQRDNQYTAPRILEKFLQQLSKLEEIHFTPDFLPVARLQDYANHPTTFKNITRVSLEERHLGVYMNSSLDWKLERLTLNLDPVSNVELIRNFLLRFSTSLKHLSIEWDKDPGVIVSQITTPWADDWLLPVKMEKLESLKFHFANVRTDETVEVCRFKTLAVALQLPRLKKLSTNSGFLCQYLREEAQRWEEAEAEGGSEGRKLHSSSLQHLEFIRVRDSNRIPPMDSGLFSGIKSLKIAVETTEPLTSAFFSQWRNVERLELDFRVLNYRECMECAQWLTGLPVPLPENYQNEKVNKKQTEEKAGIQNTFSSIRNLQNVKSLTIWGPRLSYNGLVVGDFFIYNCLIFMKNLQSVRLYNARFSKDALDDLKAELRPSVCISGGYFTPHPIAHFPPPRNTVYLPNLSEMRTKLKGTKPSDKS